MNIEPISKETIRKAEKAPVTVDGGLTVHTMPIGGGYAVWTEDVSALLAIKEESECLAEELAERNEILRYEYRREPQGGGAKPTVRSIAVGNTKTDQPHFGIDTGIQPNLKI